MPRWNRSLSLEVADAFQRDVRVPTFGSLKSALSKWLGEGVRAGSASPKCPENVQQDALARSGLLRLDLSRSPTLVIDCFESICGIAHSRWALLFDELELAPPVIVKELTRLVRSTDPRLLFKLSVSPYISDTTEIDSLFRARLVDGVAVKHDTSSEDIPPAQEHEDFDAIRLWSPYKKSGEEFCEQLANSVIRKKGFSGSTIDSILGGSAFDEPDTKTVRIGGAYAPGSAHYVRMDSLASFDASFRSYLSRKGIDLQKSVDREDDRARTLRKVQGIVIIREAFRKESGRRSRKNPKLYSGVKVFYAISESNPRLIIGLLNQMLGDVDPSTKTVRVEPSKQAAVYASATARFLAYLRTIPSPKIRPQGDSRGLLELVSKIGRFIFDEVVTRPFSDDPHTSFIVDSGTPSDLQEALQRAVNAGAIIWVPGQDDVTLLTSVKGKRFRLSYLLAPSFRLPLQLGRATSLDLILRSLYAEDNVLPYEDDEQ
jgi:hypothetical protein